MTRSGTTWLATTLARSSGVVYIREPLNPKQSAGRSPGLFRAPVNHRFQYICEENEDDYLEAFLDLTRFRYRVVEDLRVRHSLADLPLVAQDSMKFSLARVRRARALVGDPYAVFSSRWFHERLGFQLVAIVRNPLSVISSRKRLGWGVDFGQLLSQPLLVRDWLGPFQSELKEMAGQSRDLIREGSLLWRIVYHAVDQLRSSIPSMLLVRHEDLSLEPLQQFERLYSLLGLRFTAEVKRGIVAATEAGNPTELARGRPYATHLDSRANLENWRRRLTADEISRIRSLTSDVARRYYDPAGWTPAR